jgi:ATP-dependent Clp protease protease subunit
MARPESMYRKILLSKDIDKSAVEEVIKEIIRINYDDNEKAKEYVDWKREPIQLFINSYGGAVYDGLALVDIIKQSKTPVHTISIGSSMSMGLWIFLAGHKRYVGENTTLMFHDLMSWTIDKSAGIKQELDELLRLQSILIEEITSKSMVQKEVLDDYINRKAEWYIPARDAIRLKLADGFYIEN